MTNGPVDREFLGAGLVRQAVRGVDWLGLGDRLVWKQQITLAHVRAGESCCRPHHATRRNPRNTAGERTEEVSLRNRSRGRVDRPRDEP